MHKQEEESYSGSMVIKFEAFYLIWIKFARILKNERLHYHKKMYYFWVVTTFKDTFWRLKKCENM